jgi:nucleoid DNA-binding protein
MIMDKYQFVQYISQRYCIDNSLTETMLDIFADSLAELVATGQSVEIDGIGEFTTIPLFPNGINHQNNIALARIAKKHMLCFKASENLTKAIA